MAKSAMSAHTAEISAELLCDHCGYDLRAHPADGKCPECGMSVAESRRLAMNPRRPKWRDSDPRWRRRMLASVWVLVLMPLMDLLTSTGWASQVTMPNIFKLPGTYQLDETFLFSRNIYPPLIFCIGTVLLFSKERGRRHNRLDWTRRWGVICSYVVFLLSAVPVLYMCAFVSVGIGALFMSMPPRYQPGATQYFVSIGAWFILHGPYPKDIAGIVLVAFSSITILLACVSLFNALRSSGPKWFGLTLLAPLGLFALMHLVQATLACLNFSSGTSRPWWVLWALPSDNINHYDVFFWPEMLVGKIAGFQPYLLYLSGLPIHVFLVEAAKWLIVLVIAIWLSIAQFAESRGHKKSAHALTPPLAKTA